MVEMSFNMSDSKVKLLIAGVICGLVGVLLALKGNPGNMAICIACFIRDTAGSMGLHAAAPVQYFRPEIVGMVCGSFLIAIATKEYKVTAGSSPMIRFLLGMMIVIGALVFLGCPLRMVIRMAAGDLNAWIALIGFVLGVATGTVALKNGYTLGRAYETNATGGVVLPIFMAVALILAFTTALFHFTEAGGGPGALHAPVALALIGGLVFGVFAQRSRMCFAGSVRDIIMLKDFSLITIIGGFFLVMLIYNIATGNFHLSTAGQPIAHQQWLWNILGMYVVGFAAVLAGGCPLRQLIMAGQGSLDAAVTVLGMFFGAACCHNFGFASSGDMKDAATGEVTLGGTGPNGRIATIVCIVLLFLIAFVGNKRKEEKAAE